MLAQTPDAGLYLANAVSRVMERIAAAAHRAGRDPARVTLVAVTKTFPAETVALAYQAGLREFGENRVEEAAEKIPRLKSLISNPSTTLRTGLQSFDYAPWPGSQSRQDRPPILRLRSGQASTPRFHMIGHLQSRKARQAVALFDLIHSVDSASLARKLSRLCEESGRVMPVLLECNVSGEAAKYGFAASASTFFAEVETIVALPGLRVQGLMTMAPIVSDPEQARPVFAALRRLSEQLAERLGAEHFGQLSMGMSDDFEVAVEEGATIVRVGRALFGERHDEPLYG